MGILDIFRRKKQEQTPSAAAGVPKNAPEAMKEVPKEAPEQVKQEVPKAEEVQKLGESEPVVKKSEPQKPDVKKEEKGILQRFKKEKKSSDTGRSKLIINKEDTRDAYRILFRKLVTEKPTRLEQRNNQIAFEVHKDRNKPQVKEAIHRVYGVRPKHVHMIFVKGKNMRFGRSSGRRKDWKKAMVTLDPKDKIQA